MRCDNCCEWATPPCDQVVNRKQLLLHGTGAYAKGIPGTDGIDLGWDILYQLVNEERGFAYPTINLDAPLDMRAWIERQTQTTGNIVNSYEEELICIIRDYGEESICENIMKHIVATNRAPACHDNRPAAHTDHRNHTYEDTGSREVIQAKRTFRAIRWAE